MQTDECITIFGSERLLDLRLFAFAFISLKDAARKASSPRDKTLPREPNPAMQFRLRAGHMQGATMLSTSRLTAVCTVFFLLFTAAHALAEGASAERNFSASLYFGAMTDDNWRQSVSGQADFVDSHIVAGALAWTFYRPENLMWSLELEGNVAQHFGIQDHTELNAPILTARWEYFPWDTYVDTSLAFGIGPSFATEVPEQEKNQEGSSEEVLLFWHIEAEFGLPDSDWSTFVRLHHRSTGYGLMAEHGGGNILSLGLRYDF
jgi:hypothetical protein